MPSPRRLSLVALALTLLLSACPSEHDPYTAHARFDVAAAVEIPPGTAPPDALAERSIALRASRSRVAAAAAQEDVEARAILQAAADRAAAAAQRAAQTIAAPQPVPSAWRTASVTWYGPGLYGNGTACGQRMTPEIVGVAHKSLPCGTLITFEHGGRVVTAPVIDRGPYAAGREFDLSRGLCEQLAHCFTGSINYRVN